ncbi:MAG: endolytic transglycosylase MltG [Minisyncoccia bacterium]
MEPQENQRENISSKIFTLQNSILVAEILILIAVIAGYITFIYSAPTNFPANTVLTIKQGETISSTATLLGKKEIIKSEFLFKVSLYLFGRGKIMAGDYYFKTPQNLMEIVLRISNSEYDLTPIKVLIPEGTNTKEMAEILSKNIPTFSKNTFLTLATPQEGYLFPDTYLFLPDQKNEDIINVMKNTFSKRLKSIEGYIFAFKKPLADVIKMASILEGEARTTETRRIIAGILWRRISLGMLLQVDTSFKYINGKNSFDLTSEDLSIDSPYNSYTYKGLPPTPISNPGLDAILSAVTPIQTKYLYFLTDREGNMHYAVNYAEHLVNKEKYLQ